ncbi:glycosyltransferase family 4 protein [Palaeococcus ferrophilus]|uniref:glycosyltransferase family 4 protein n=1 Tax=Palaeococcus ferrophilus TaxID=83868 RepID=UPI00316AECD7
MRGTSCTRLGCPPVFGLRGTSFALLASKKIVELHKEYGFDVVHAHFVGTTSYSAVLARERIDAPLVVTAHGSDLEFTSKLPLGRFFVKESLIRADAVVAVSHYLALKAISLGAHEVKVISNGVAVLGEKNEKREFVTFVGALRSYKGLDDFLKLAEYFPEERFLVLGDGPLRVLEERAPPNMEFLGYRRDVEEFLGRSKLLVVPSRREGFGLVVLEANRAEVPVVARRVGALPELVRDGKNGLLFGDTGELVRAVEYYLRNPAARERAGRIGRALSKRYSWEESVSALESLYASLVSGH